MSWHQTTPKNGEVNSHSFWLLGSKEFMHKKAVESISTTGAVFAQQITSKPVFYNIEMGDYMLVYQKPLKTLGHFVFD